MKSFKSLVLTFFLCFLFVSLVSARDKVILLNQGGGGSSSEWTLSGTGITPTTADSASNPGSYTSTASTGVFQFGTQASEGMRYSPVTGGGRLGIGTTAPAAPVDISPVSGDTVHPLIVRSPAVTKGLYIDSQAVAANGFFYLAPHPDYAYAWKTDFSNGFWDIYEGTTFIARIGNDAFKLQDGIEFQFGESPDYKIVYDETTDDRLELKNDLGQDLMTITAGSGFNFLTDVALSKDVVYSGSGSGTAYGGIYQYSNTTAITIASSGVYYTVTNWDANSSDSNLTTPTFGSDYIQVTNAGVYFVSLSLAFQGTSNDDICFAIHSDDGATKEESLHLTATVQATGDWTPVSISGLVRLAAGEKIYLKVENKTAANNILIDDANMTLFQVGG